MKVKNYIVENCYEFLDELERELCKNGISYVRIDKEFHFLDQIIRFYDFELDKRIICSMTINKINVENVVYSDFSLNKSSDDKNFYQKQNKKTLKCSSIIVNQKIKKYSK